MPPDEQFAEWAALFIRQYGDEEPGLAAAVPLPDALEKHALTLAARDLLASVDAGGVPAFVSNNLRQIAQDNGIEITPQWTPNDIIDALRAKAEKGVSSGPAASI